MTEKSFVDTNVLLYAHEETAGRKFGKAQTLIENLWAERAAVISTQVLQEFLVNLQRKTRRKPSALLLGTLVEDFTLWTVVVNDASSCVRALEVQERYGLSFWDSLIVQAAQISNAKVLYSEDLSDGQVYGGVKVVNPFV
jgi:predicted nucleic acid-binding protein